MDQSIVSGVAEIAPGVKRAPVPAWVDLAPYERPAAGNPHFISGGVCALLDDTQADLTGPDRAWFSRRADMVTAPAGAERIAHYQAAFDPSYERLEIHFVRILRGDRVIDHTETANFEVMRRERNLEQLKFDGRLSVHFAIPDVRVGDIVEIGQTYYGMRPILGGRHSVIIGFEWRNGVIETRHRLRAPASRNIHARAVNAPPEPIVTEADGIVETRWRAHERPAAKLEVLAPPWLVQRAEIQFSEWRDWSEVAATFTPVYEETGDIPAEFAEEIARIEAEAKTPEQRAAEVLRFVQNAIRYLAVSIGDGGFVPRPLAEIGATRYGDCKDKTKLFVIMARRLGLDACPALVNTGEGVALDEWQPTAEAFDHCLVRLKLSGKIYWLDPTNLMQPSRLDCVAQSRYGWALPLAPGVSALESMSKPPFLHSLECQEKVELGEGPEIPVRYQWRLIYRGWRAESVRSRLAQDGIVGFFRDYAEAVTRVWPNARPVRQDVVSDDLAENVLTLYEEYEIPEAWTKVEGERWRFSTLDLAMRSLLPKLDPGRRQHPIYLGQIGRVSRRAEITTRAAWSIAPFKKRIEASTMSVESEFRPVSKTLFELTQTLDLRDWVAPPSDAQAYRDILAELEISDVRFEDQASGGKFVGALKTAEKTSLWALALPFVIAAFVILFIYAGGADFLTGLLTPR